MSHFKLVSEYQPQGDQPQAIETLAHNLVDDCKYQTLLGVTGSGKTFTVANVIALLNKPTLIISHNKTLAAQLYSEFKKFFPQNAVEYFISYYDYYQPEAYIPTTDTYIEKDTSINEEIERLRLRATSSLIHRRDVIIVASVSCIYGLGDPEDYQNLLLLLQKNKSLDRKIMFERLIDILYIRNDVDFKQGVFRVRGDVVDIYPAYELNPVRVEFWGDEIEKISTFNAITGEIFETYETFFLFPAKHFVTTESKMTSAIESIEAELKDRLAFLRKQNKLLEAQRLESRTYYDIEMLTEVGYCSGIENYSRHIANRKVDERPACLIDYFPDDFLLIVDESHVTIPQVRAMYNGDRARKTVLVEHGFRLPSALDNRPLKFDEFESMIHQAIFVSATPADYELEKCEGEVVEQIIRPTGLMDPCVEMRPTPNQIDDLINEVHKRVTKKERVLVTTLTKRMAEDLTDYLSEAGIRVRYLHSEIDALERVDIIRSLRLAEFDVLVGINLLREGLDLPEVSLVAILDADKEGFLRSERSLMQTAGRAARNVEGMVLLYADRKTKAIQALLDETLRRRQMQAEYNETHKITPQTIYKSADAVLTATTIADRKAAYSVTDKTFSAFSKMGKEEYLESLQNEMLAASEKLEFEQAAKIRDEIERLRNKKQDN